MQRSHFLLYSSFEYFPAGQFYIWFSTLKYLNRLCYSQRTKTINEYLEKLKRSIVELSCEFNTTTKVDLISKCLQILTFVFSHFDIKFKLKKSSKSGARQLTLLHKKRFSVLLELLTTLHQPFITDNYRQTIMTNKMIHRNKNKIAGKMIYSRDIPSETRPPGCSMYGNLLIILH